jgi:hypothetical protein
VAGRIRCREKSSARQGFPRRRERRIRQLSSRGGCVPGWQVVSTMSLPARSGTTFPARRDSWFARITG